MKGQELPTFELRKALLLLMPFVMGPHVSAVCHPANLPLRKRAQQPRGRNKVDKHQKFGAPHYV
ncbi:MAG: hypothetical protein WCH04_19605 [Gammaproteobacteria bacterium]